MKLEEKIKNKFLYKKGKNFFKYLYFFTQTLKGLTKYKKSHSFGAQDLLIEYFFKNKSNGVYLDVGCYHPFLGSNTYKLFKKGWSGINIDLDFHSIDFFNHCRKRDLNIQIGASDVKGEVDYYFVHNRSAINSLDSKRSHHSTEVKKMPVDTLDNIIENSKFRGKKIDLVSIDVEGYEMKVLKGFDLEKYSPDLIFIEHVDLSMKKLEFYNQNIDNVLNSEIHIYMKKNNYSLVNWLHSDLVYVSDKIKDV